MESVFQNRLSNARLRADARPEEHRSSALQKVFESVQTLRDTNACGVLAGESLP